MHTLSEIHVVYLELIGEIFSVHAKSSISYQLSSRDRGATDLPGPPRLLRLWFHHRLPIVGIFISVDLYKLCH